MKISLSENVLYNLLISDFGLGYEISRINLPLFVRTCTYLVGAIFALENQLIHLFPLIYGKLSGTQRGGRTLTPEGTGF